MKVNIKDAIRKVEVDPEVGVGIAKMVESDKLSVHIAVVKPGTTLKKHYHKHRDEVYIIVDGEGEVYLGDKVVKVSRGDIVIIPRETIHGIRNTADRELVFMFISAPPFNPKEDRFIVED